MTTARTQRPWFESFKSATAKAKRTDDYKIRDAGLDQVHKLARNYIASLDIGGPNMVLVNEVDRGCKFQNATGKDKYLEWVRNWKNFYYDLSNLIRHFKKEDRNELFRLKETAQVMLNARHVGKLASWAIVQRTKRLNAT